MREELSCCLDQASLLLGLILLQCDWSVHTVRELQNVQMQDIMDNDYLDV